MKNKDLYLEIKNSIGAVDTKLGIRIAVLGVISTIIVMLLIYKHQPPWVFFLALVIPVIEWIIATVGLVGVFGDANKIKPARLEYRNKYYFNHIASFKNEKEYIHYNPGAEDKELLKQIYINAKILARKHKLFELSFLFIWMLRKLFRFIKRK